jgi:hypothetical protein
MAYIDPGSGSYLLQLIIGTALGVGAVVALGFRRTIGRLFRRKKKDAPPVVEAAPPVVEAAPEAEASPPPAEPPPAPPDQEG